MAQGKTVDYVLIDKISHRQTAAAGSRFSLKSPTVVKILSQREDVKEIVRDGDQVIVHFNDGDVLTIENFYREDSDIPNDLVFEDRDSGELWHWIADSGSADGLVPLRSIEPLLITDDDGSIAPILLGMGALAGLGAAIAGGGDGDKKGDDGNHSGNANRAPMAVDDAAAATEDTPFTSTVSLLANDTDPDGDTLTAVAGTFATAQGGSVTINADGSYVYTPAANFSGADSFTYTVSDGKGGTDTGTVALTVTPANGPPVAVDHAQVAVDYVTMAVDDTPLTSTVSLLANDTDPDGDTLTAVAGTFATAQGGSVTINADGSYVYTPAANFSGTDSFTYTVSDGKGGTDTGTVVLTVTPVNDAPVAVDDAATAVEAPVKSSTRSSRSIPAASPAASSAWATSSASSRRQPPPSTPKRRRRWRRR